MAELARQTPKFRLLSLMLRATQKRGHGGIWVTRFVVLIVLWSTVDHGSDFRF